MRQHNDLLRADLGEQVGLMAKLFKTEQTPFFLPYTLDRGRVVPEGVSYPLRNGVCRSHS
jgi:hypothetical protein